MLQVGGRLETPPQFEDFDWRGYLASKGIGSLVRYPRNIELLASGQGFKAQEWLYGLRNRVSQALETALPQPQGSLAQAILLGKRSAMPDELNQSFFRTGTTHIIAISGLNISILDAGCGTGEITGRLAELYPEATVLGVDIIDAHLELARARLASLGSRVRFEHRSIFDLGLEDASFDLVTCI